MTVGNSGETMTDEVCGVIPVLASIAAVGWGTAVDFGTARVTHR